MAKKQKKQEDKIYEAEQRAEAKARGFFERYSKIISIATTVLLVLVVLGYGYKQLILVPKEEKAQTVMIKAQQYFEKDSFNLALNGDGVSVGFKEIIQKYGGTPAGKGARLYAGISALQTGAYQEAVQYLEEFSSDDPLLNARKYGCIGDAKAELNDMKAAADNYQKAIDANPENNLTTPFYLYKLGTVQVINNQKDLAAQTFEKLSEQFPTSAESSAAEKDLAELQAVK